MPNPSGYSGASVYRSNPCKNVSTPAFRSAEPKKHGNIFRCTIISLICSPAILPVSKKLSIAVSSSMAISSIIVLLFSFSCASSSVPAPSSVKSMHPSDNCFFNSKRIAALSVPGWSILLIKRNTGISYRFKSRQSVCVWACTPSDALMTSTA